MGDSMPTFLELSIKIQGLLCKMEEIGECKEYYKLRDEVINLMVLQRNIIDQHFNNSM